MGDVFDRWRLNNGWNPWDDGTQMAAIASFVHSLDAEGVPANAYTHLYERVLKSRVTAIQAGKQLPSFGVELLLAEWLGPYGLQAEWKQREIDAGRILTGNAETQCPGCFGTGMKLERDPVTGSVIGSGGHCNHEHSGEESEVVTMPFEPPSVPQPSLQTSVQICSRIRQELARIHILAEDAETATAAWDASRTWAHAEAYCRRVDA